MARRIIILDNQANRVRYALWADVPAARQTFYANPTAVSQFKNADAGELAAIRTGAIAERVDVLQIDGLNLAQTKTALESIWTAYQAEITAFNPWNRYGSSWDGTTWTNVTVA